MKKKEKAANLELRLLNALRKDSSASISKLARKLKEPVTTVFEAEKRLLRKGIVTRYYPALDFEKAGFAIRALFLMNAEESKMEETTDFLLADDSVNNLQILEGTCNIFVESVFSKMEDLFEFNELLADIKKKTVFYTLEEVKTEAAAVF